VSQTEAGKRVTMRRTVDSHPVSLAPPDSQSTVKQVCAFALPDPGRS
jgi:hypothetical protein